MTDQTTQVRAIATQLIRQAIKQIDSETACDHVVATLGEDVDVDALAFGSESAVRKARIDISWDGAPAAPPLSPVVQSPVREQLLNAIDATFCQSLGYATPEGLLAAYEASRTQTVDRDALRDRIDATLRTTRRIGYEGKAGHGTHRYDACCALCAGDVDALTEALAAAVLPATTNHDTDTSVTHRCADCGSGFVPGSDVELTHNCDDHRDAEPAPVDRAAVLREAANALAALGPVDSLVSGPKAWAEAVETLRRVADETAATETQAATVDELAHALDNTTPYPIELDRDLCRYMAERLLEMVTVTKRPGHDVWQPDEESSGDQPDPIDPDTLTDRLRCPQCGEDVTDYSDDDHVFRESDDRPYCSGECVVATDEPAAGARQDGAQPGGAE